LSPQVIRFPQIQNEVQAAINEFQEFSQFPQVVGTIDGSHIAVIGPCHNRADNFNSKRFYSIVGQAVVGGQVKFLDVFVGCPGSLHDACMYRFTKLYERIENGES